MNETGEKIRVTIDRVAHGGDGVARVDGLVCFVAAALPGDVVEARVTRRGKSALWAEIVSVLEPSPDRLTDARTAGSEPGGASWLHFAYPAQAEWKRRIVADCFERIAKIPVTPDWIEDESLRLGYRTRAQFHGDGEHTGFFAAGSHTVVDTDGCPLCHARLNEALAQLKPLRIKGNVTVTVNPEGDETLVWSKFVRRSLREAFPLANAPSDKRKRSQFLFDGIPIVNGAFAQSSLLLNRRLVAEAHAHMTNAPSVLDLYCGSGNLSLTLPERVDVLGIDHSRPAINAAYALRKGAYLAGGEDRMRKAIAEDRWDTIVLDPPRAGAKALAPALAKAHANRLIYVSCDPATLARDVAALCAGRWRLERVAAIDLFPNTAHVETVSTLLPRQ